MSKHCDGIGETPAVFSVCIGYLNPAKPTNGQEQRVKNSASTQSDRARLNGSGKLPSLLESNDWATLKGNDLLVSKGARRFRLGDADIEHSADAAHLLADANSMAFEPVKAPPGITHWSDAKNRG